MTRRPRRALAVLGAACILLPLVAAAPASATALPASLPRFAAAGSDECSAATRIARTPPALGVLQSELAWGETRGSGVVVAVVDSGVNAGNPHLADAMAGGVDLVGDGLGADGLADLDGHGTAIAGQIAARGTEGSGVVGLAPEARILSVRVFAGVTDQQIEAGHGPNVARLAAGIRYAADFGAQIVNVSLSTSSASDELRDAVAYATSRGSLVVASGGNRDLSLSFEENQSDGARYPAGEPDAIGVAATGPDGLVTEASIHGPHIGLSAPGSEVLTTSAAGGDCVFAEDPATSFASGYVAAAAALVAAAHPDETPQQWAYRLEATAVRTDPDVRDDVSGWGLVQPYDAIVLVPGPGIRGPESPFPGTEAAPAPAPTQTPVTIAPAPPANAPALLIGLVGSVGALVVLGVLGAIGILLRRRRTPPEIERAASGGGLFREDASVDSPAD